MTEPNGNGGVRITLRDIYDLLQNLRDEVKEGSSTIGHLATEIKRVELDSRERDDFLRTSLEAKDETHDERFTKLETGVDARFRSLELRYYGILAGLIGAIAVIVKVATG